MIRPVNFGFNTETADSNAFQNRDLAAQAKDVAQEDAQREFNEMARQLQAMGVEVMIYDDTTDPYTPDSIFPNNWVSFHASGKVVLYPMQAANRRLERRPDIINDLAERFDVANIIDLTYFEQEGKFLEGTGSLVLDRMNRVAFAGLSPRTHPDVLAEFARRTGYRTVSFQAADANGNAVYHTNVLMCIGDTFAVVCLSAITDPDERLMVRQELERLQKRVIDISLEQMANFAGNMLMVQTQKGQKLLVMSTRAYQSLTPKQIDLLDDYVTLLHFDLSTIEGNGGGSARCMMAEVHLPIK
ncbi:arginine deiminase-related protein [Spirosoma sp. RP8]|uniref:Arginine deiminase-related protein n=2 Tax=Cytophagaceae TaxID=89373 RepID=A0ABT0HN08_9BACT|nr:MULTISPECIES: arginine deiminase-related protein [Spirosoma]MCK8492950.1 arginine deiminase-related protein [Spirosoma liriopis]UHG92351.1 arginine deiminase-related protein [Spirosoma oryzicola]